MSYIGIIAVISYLIFFWCITSGLAHFVCYLIEKKEEYKIGTKKNLIIATISFFIFYLLASIFMNSYKF